MKTVYYTFTTRDGGVKAAGFDPGPREGRQTAMIRQTDGRTVRDGGKVIDLSAWRSANLDEFQEEPDRLGRERGGLPSLAPRPRGSRRSMPAAELASTLGVVAVALALILRILTF